MAELTLVVDDEVVRNARAAAHRRGSTLEALVQEYVESLATRNVNGQPGRIADQLQQLWRESSGQSGDDSFRREDAYAERLK